MASSVALGRPRRVDWHPQHFHTVCLGGTHPYHVLGPLTRPLRHSQGPQKGPFWPFWGPRRSLGSPGGPDLGPSATGWSNWVGRIHIMCSGPFRDHYGTPGAPKRAVLAQIGPFGGPGGPRWAPGGHIWSQLSLIGLSVLDSWSSHTLTRYRAPSGPPGAPKGPVLAQTPLLET